MRSGRVDGRRAGPPRLSRRELEVAKLVADGLTDQEIARHLFLSRRTAEGHVQSIRNKLGLDNRSQVATWYTREALAEPAASGEGILPVHLTTFFGREAELARITGLLERARGVTITGPAGGGKTRLAVRVAEDLQARFSGGTWFVDLSSLGEPDAVLPALAATLDVREQEAGGLLAAITARLGGRSRHPCLLVLDNCEHLVDRCATLVESLLTSCPRLSVLATSREPLLFDGEVVWKLAPLSLPPAGTDPTPEAILASDAVRLFCDRALLSDPVFVLDAAAAPAVLALCRRLDGLPLALELAAAQVGPLTLEGVLDRLGERLDFLHRRSEPARHQTLVTAVRWSYDLLDERLQGLFRQLAVFRGGFDEEAARRVCGQPAEDLPALVEKSLVVPVDRARFTMLETIRQFAAEMLEESGEGDGLRERHLGYVLDLAARPAGALPAPGQAAWLSDLAREYDNVRAALETSRRLRPQVRLELALAVHRFWLLRGRLSEGRAWLEDAIAAGDELSAQRARALNALAGLIWRQGDYTRASAHLEASLEIWRTLEDEEGIQRCLANLGVLAAAQADFGTARARYEESLALASRGGDRRAIAFLESNLGVAEAELGGHARARALLHGALATLGELGDRAAVGATLVNLGILDLIRDDPASAGRRYLEALEIFVSIGETPDAASCLEGLGCVAAREGRPELGVRLAGCADGLRRSLGTPAGPAARLRLERWLPAARGALGPGADAAWKAGTAMPAGDALELLRGVTA